MMPGVTAAMTTAGQDQDHMGRVARSAYLMVKGSVAEDLVTREELLEALQCAGFNPTQRTIARHWTQATTSVTFSQFCDLVEIEPIPSEKSLLMMFEKLDTNNLGYLTHDEFILNMTSRGDKLPAGVIENLIANKEYNEDKKFMYRKFCSDVIETSKKLSNLALEQLQKDEDEFMVNSKTYKVRRKTASPDKSLSSSPAKSLSSPTKSVVSSSSNKCDSEDVVTPTPTPTNLNCHLKSKGCFYFENETIISHQYSLTVKSRAPHRISVTSEQQYHNTAAAAPVDVQLYVFDENKRLVARTGDRDAEGRSVWEGDLGPGKFTLVPFTSGARLKRRLQGGQGQAMVPLVDKQHKIKLSRDFQNVLADMFSKADLDGNGTLSRTEFNLFNWRTSGEEVSDEEWAVVVANFPLEQGELTLDGFLTLHHMEAEDNGGDEAELRVTLQTMGYNPQLVQDESSCFHVTVSSSQPFSSLAVSALKSPGLLLEKSVTRCAMQCDSSPTKVRGASSVLVYKEVAEDRVTFVIQNKSEHSATIQLDLSRSSGIVISRPRPVFTVSVAKKSSVVAAHVLPLSCAEDADWSLEAEAKYVRG